MTVECEHLRSRFQAYFGVPPFPFQLATAERLLEDRNVVLQAPTGAGKTRAAIFPWLYAREAGLSFADRLIYALPLRTLTSALYYDTKAMLEQRMPGVNVKIQMGSDPQDSFFEGDIVFTTIDQLLSAYIGVPVSLSPRMANLPAGALIGAYVVFDEFHLLEPARALTTALDLGRRFEPYTRMLLMTATFPDAPRRDVASRIGADLVEVTDTELREIPSQRNKMRRFLWHDEPLQAKDVVTSHQDRTIAVVNQVDRAQELFRAVKDQLDAKPETERPELLLLHSRFLPDDRKEVENRIEGRFKEGGSGNAILVATQVVEVGLDISADVMHSDVAPAASLFQRAGRCARFAGQSGTVHVYALPMNERGRTRYGPYQGGEEELVETTGREVARRTGETIGYGLERAIVDEVHGEADADALRAVSPERRASEVEVSIANGEPGKVSELVRRVDAVTILVHDNPSELRLDRRPQAFSLDRNVFRWLLGNVELGGEPPPVVTPRFEDDERLVASVEWEPVKGKLSGGSLFMACVHPSVVSYDGVLGLELGRSGTFRSVETVEEHDVAFPRYSYHREPYGEHVANAVARARTDSGRYAVGRERLSRRAGVRAESIEELATLAVALHDVGKLSSGWQDAIWRWQEDVCKTRRQGFLAHSDFDGTDRQQRAMSRRERYKKPPHAAEGAYASLPVLRELAVRLGVQASEVMGVVWALASAIARHHGARTSNLSEFRLAAGARAEVARSLSWIELPVTLFECDSAATQVKFRDSLVGARGTAYPLYLFAARRIRLADQESLSGG